MKRQLGEFVLICPLSKPRSESVYAGANNKIVCPHTSKNARMHVNKHLVPSGSSKAYIRAHGDTPKLPMQTGTMTGQFMNGHLLA